MDYREEFLNSHNYEYEMFNNFDENKLNNKLKEDEVEILYLIGQRGKIQDGEYKDKIVGF